MSYMVRSSDGRSWGDYSTKGEASRKARDLRRSKGGFRGTFRVVKANTGRKRNPPSKRKQRKMAARVRWADTPAKKNAPRMKRLNKSTPWIPATAVKIVRNKGRYEVLYRRKRSAVKKRPARRKTARRR
jgi:hypothetical protein